MHQHCHFDPDLSGRRNLFALTNLSYPRDDKKIEICHWQRSRSVFKLVRKTLNNFEY